MRNANRRFEQMAKRMGFEVIKGKVYRDVDEILFKGIKQFSIPGRMNAYHNSLHLFSGTLLPHLEEMQTKLRMYWFRNKQSHYYGETIKEVANQKFNPHEYEI